MFFISLFGFIVANIYFLSGVWFSSYTLLLEGRKGIDALTTSIMLVRGRRIQICWRMIVIMLMALVPISIILGPVYAKIVAHVIPQLMIGAMLAFQFHIFPALPSVSSALLLWQAVLGFVACLVAVPIFVALNYFLWKDVKATALPFDKKHYTKTRRLIKTCASIGAVLLVLVLCGIVSVLTR